MRYFFRPLVVSTVFLSTPFFSLARSPSFTGAYVGGSVGYRNFSTTITQDAGVNQNKYKFTGGGSVFEAMFGVGKSWKRVYLGYEFSTGFNGGRAKRDTNSVGNNWQFGLAARIGAPMPDASIMPYFGLGFEYRQMDFKTATTSSFYNYSIAPLLGGEFMVDDSWRIRVEGAYQLGIKNTNLPAAYKFKSSPTSFVFKTSVIYTLSSD